MRNQRAEKFCSLLVKDPWYSKLGQKLKASDVAQIAQFINENGDLAPADFEFKLNRLFLDHKEKPKNWTLIMEFLMICTKI